MRSYAFLGDALLPYQAAVTAEVAARTGRAIDVTRACGLEELEAVAAGEPALVYLCGLPYTRLRDRGLPLEPLAAPVSALDPEVGACYRSVLLARPGLTGTALGDLADLRLAINGYDSMSGWVLPVGSGLPLERFAAVEVTGTHRASLDLLLAEGADAAPIDSMLLAGERIHDERLDALPVLATHGPSPAPPVVLVGADAALADELRAALVALHEDADGRAALERGRMLRLDPVADADYDLTRGCDRRAAPWTP
jgi:ABC-type phosphate/phosphonate transport system substrate-binding protein